MLFTFILMVGQVLLCKGGKGLGKHPAYNQ